MSKFNVFNILQKVYGARGLPFPQKPDVQEDDTIVTISDKPDVQEDDTIVSGFNIYKQEDENINVDGTPIRIYSDKLLGKYEYMPVTIDDMPIPNAIIMISGEKEFIETNIVGAIDGNGQIRGATVFEKAFTKPYDITVIATMIGENNKEFPLEVFKEMVSLWQKDTVVTVKCALTNFFLEKTNNALIKKIAVLDNAGAENVEIIQIDLRSNIEFELEFNQ